MRDEVSVSLLFLRTGREICSVRRSTAGSDDGKIRLIDAVLEDSFHEAVIHQRIPTHTEGRLQVIDADPRSDPVVFSARENTSIKHSVQPYLQMTQTAKVSPPAAAKPVLTT